RTRYDNYTKATPAITPAKNCGKWWVSWRNPDKGGVIALLDNSGAIISQKTFSAGDPTSTRFISITSHLFNGAPQTDTCHMAFEEGPRHGGAEIHYLQAYCKADGTIDTMRLTHVCRGLPYCENHYPNIAMTGNYG